MEERQIVQQMFDGLFDIVTGSGFYTVEDVQKKKLKLKKQKVSVENVKDTNKESSEPGPHMCITSPDKSESLAKDGKTLLCKSPPKKIFLGKSDFSRHENEELENERKRKLANKSCEEHIENQTKRPRLDLIDSVAIKGKKGLSGDVELNESNSLRNDSVSTDVFVTSQELDTNPVTKVRGFQACQSNSDLVISSNENDSTPFISDTLSLTVTKCETFRSKKAVIKSNSPLKNERSFQVCTDNPDLVVSSRTQRKKCDLLIKSSEKKIPPVVNNIEERLPPLLDLPLLLPGTSTDKKDVDRESNVSSDSRASGYSKARGMKQSPRKKDLTKDEKQSTSISVRPKNKLSLKRKSAVGEENTSKTKRRKVSVINPKSKKMQKKPSNGSTKNTGKRKTIDSEMKCAKENTLRGRLNASSRAKLKHTKKRGSQVEAKRKIIKRSNQNEKEKRNTRNLPRRAKECASKNAYLELSPVSATKIKSERRKLTSKCRFCMSSHNKVSSNHQVIQSSKSKSPNCKRKSKVRSSTNKSSDSKALSKHQVSHMSNLKSAYSKTKSKMRTTRCKCSKNKLSSDSRATPRSKLKTKAKSPCKMKKERSIVKGQTAKSKRGRPPSKLRIVKDGDSSILKQQVKILADHSRQASREETDIMSALCKLEDKSKSLHSQDLEELMPMRDSVTAKTCIYEHGVNKDTHPGGVWKKLVLEN